MCECLATFSWRFSAFFSFLGATPQLSPTSLPLRFLVDFTDCQAKGVKEKIAMCAMGFSPLSDQVAKTKIAKHHTCSNFITIS